MVGSARCGVWIQISSFWCTAVSGFGFRHCNGSNPLFLLLPLLDEIKISVHKHIRLTMGDRNAEIWSTRLQREILALESSDDESEKMELLPPFIKTIGHTLSIEGGIAKIEFRIDVII